MILSLVGSGLMAALMAGIGASKTQRGTANLQVASRNAAAMLETLPYIRCGTVAEYQDAVDNSEDAPNPRPTIAAVFEWNGIDGSDLAFVAAGGACPDRGLQRIEFTVAGVDGRTREGDVLKRYDGSTPVPDIVQPVGTTRCTISGTDVTDDTTVAADAPGTNFGSDDTMNVSENGARSTAFLRFELAAGTPCTGDGETGSLPPLNENQVIRNAALRLYTWQVNGGPDCSTECTHAPQRAGGAWNEGDVTWSNAPNTAQGGAIQFSHGSGTGDWGPRFQEVTGPQLVSDVQSFYSTPGANRGWRITQACASTGFPATGCTTTPPGFQIRTSEWATASERPALTLWYSPAASSARQLRNIGLDRCAAVKGASLDDTPADLSKASIVSLECDGAVNQGWTYDPASQTIRNERSGRCLNILICSNPDTDPPQIRQLGQYALFLQGQCGDANARWTFDGPAIKDYKGRCLEITGGNTAIGTLIQVNPNCDGSPKQQWSYEPLTDRLNHPTTAHRILNDVFGNCVDNFGSLEGFPCFGGQTLPTQNWHFNGNGRIVNQANFNCLDGDTGAAGVAVQGTNCNLGAQQQWVLDTTTRQIRNLERGMCLRGNFDASAPTLQVCDTNNAEQRWNIEDATGAQDRRIIRQLRSVSDNNCLEVSTTPPGNGTSANAWPCLGTSRPAQAYLMLNVAYNTAQMRPVTSLTDTTPRCLEASGTGTGTDANVQTWQCKGEGQMRWHVRVLNSTREAFAVAPGTDTPVTYIRNIHKTNACLQNNGVTAQANTRTCNASAIQNWVIEPIQAYPYSDGFHGQIRNVGTNSCMEPVDPNGNSDIISWPCTGSTRPGQELVLLTNGQIHMTSGAARCLDWEDSGNSG